MQVAFADPCCDVLASRVAFRVDPRAEPGDVVGALARLLIQTRRRRRQAVGDDREQQEPALVGVEGYADAQ